MKRYALTKDAHCDLGQIRSGPLQRLGRCKAGGYRGNRVMCELAARYPAAGRKEPELLGSSGVTRSLPFHPYRIYYYSEIEPVLVFAVLDGRRNVSEILKKR